jgi:hypothetical protein
MMERLGPSHLHFTDLLAPLDLTGVDGLAVTRFGAPPPPGDLLQR